jgi:hypothetical protein
MYYGHSGTGKSEAALRVAKLVLAQRPGTIARVVVGDGSGATPEDSGLVDEGLNKVASWEGRDWPTTTLNQVAEGYWPADVLDPKSPLVKPTTDDLAKTSVWIFEGLSVAGGYVMGDQKGGLAQRGGQGEKIGQDSPVRVVDCELDKLGNCKKDTGPGEQYGGNPIAHYQFAQKRLLGFIERAKALPGEFMIMTAHERSAEDKTSKETVIGPEVAGGALTAGISKYFGSTLHFTTAEKREKVKDAHTGRLGDDLDIEFRTYTRAHISPTTGIKYVAVTRGGLTAEEMPLYLTSDIPGNAIEEFYTRLANVRKLRQEAAAKLKGTV